MLLEILPRKGIGPIEFGMTSLQAQRAMKGFCGAEYTHRASSKGVDYFFGSALEVSYDGEGKAEFMGAQYYSNCGCDFVLFGADPFDMEAESLFELISSQESTTKHVFNPDDYLFKELILTLWNSEEQYDYKGNETRAVYAQVGVGNEQYLQDIA